MAQRMFVALIPPEEIREEIAEFLSARPQISWVPEEQWHITLSFMKAVPDRKIDDLVLRLARGFRKQQPPLLGFRGAGAFPDAVTAKVLWLRPDLVEGDLGPLAVTARNAANKAGVQTDGQTFVPHMTVARFRRAAPAGKWLQVLDTFSSEVWLAEEAHLVASYLREGPGRRPRYETVATFKLSEDADQDT